MATTDIATELAGRQAKVSEAEQVVREVEAQAREAANRLELASREFAALPPDQLDETGNPKPKTEAARLAAQIKARTASSTSASVALGRSRQNRPSQRTTARS